MVSMEEQMSLFEMGGLADDGAMRDPVSGNEVPPGSMATEVRDDVPAMLSEGEYIVPADVVRFFGVKFFEDLRSQAKSGLMDMERGGRIGGEPVDAPQEDLTPEEMAMLAEITGMARGGMVKGYQEGGMVNQTFTPTPNYGTPGFSLFQPTQAAAPTPTIPQTQSMTLYGPNGEIVTLNLPTDQQRYNALLGQGYTTEQRIQGSPVRAGERDRDQTSEAFDFNSEPSEPRGLDPEVYGALMEDPLKFGLEQLESRDFTRLGAGAGNLLGGPALGLVGGAIGAGITLNNVAQARAASQIASARGLDTTALDKAVDDYVRNLPNISRVASSIFASGDNIARRFFEQEATETARPATPSRPPATGEPVGSTLPPARERESSDTVFAPTSSPRPTSRPSDSQLSSAGQASKAAAQKANEKAKAEAQLADIQSGKKTTGRVGFEQGGLVARPSRKKPVAKK
jgi:DNA-binding phage protein